MPNDATLDLHCQQYGDENHFRVSACLFPRIFSKYRFWEFLEHAGAERFQPSEIDILIASDWFCEAPDPDGYEIAELMRLAVSWRLEPPTAELRKLADEVRSQRGGFWRSTLLRPRVLAAVDAVYP